MGRFRLQPPWSPYRRFGWRADVPHLRARRLAVAGRCHGCRAPGPLRSDGAPDCRQHARAGRWCRHPSSGVGILYTLPRPRDRASATPAVRAGRPGYRRFGWKADLQRYESLAEIQDFRKFGFAALALSFFSHGVIYLTPRAVMVWRLRAPIFDVRGCVAASAAARRPGQRLVLPSQWPHHPMLQKVGARARLAPAQHCQTYNADTQHAECCGLRHRRW